MAAQIGPKAETPGGQASLRVAAFAILLALTIAALDLGREIFVPISLAVLLSFVLAPGVKILQRFHVPRALAVIGSVVFAFLVLFALGSIIAAQLNRLAGDLPKYQATIESKIDSVRGFAGGSSTLKRAAGMLKDLGEEIKRPNEENTVAKDVPRASQKPLQVEVLQPEPGTLDNIRSLIAPLISPLATTGIIIIFVVFILIQREDLRNRLIRLAGSGDIQRTTAALDDAASRLSRLLLSQLLINSGFGVLVGMGLALIGVPNAVLWGILAAVLRFVPYIGSLIAAAFPLALSLAVDPGWSMLLWTAALFLVCEPVVGHVIEPTLYGRSTGLSPVAVVLSATFWTALWGPIGLVLSTPLTVCLVVLGRHVERLSFLDIMFGDRPALSPPEIFYQRMLAGDPTEAAEVAEEFLKERSLSSYMEDVALRGLLLAKQDLDRGALDRDRMERIRDTVQALCEDFDDLLEDRVPAAGRATSDTEAAAALDAVSQDQPAQEAVVFDRETLPDPWDRESAIVCVGGATALDDASAMLFARLLRAHGLSVGVELAQNAKQRSQSIVSQDIALICLNYLGSVSLAEMRFAARLIGRKAPNVPILIGCWILDQEQTPPNYETTPYRAVSGFRQGTAFCVRQVQNACSEASTINEAQAPQPRVAAEA